MKIDSIQVGPIMTNCYLLCDDAAGVCCVIDPGDEPARVEQTRLNDGRLDELFQIGAVRVGARTLGHLQDQRRLQLSRRLRDALDDLHIVDVEGTDGVAAVIGLFEHFRRCNQCHNISLLFMTDQWAGSLFYAIL